MVILVAIILGLILGSFLSVLIGRWPQWRGVAWGRSQCLHCMQMLAWYDLIPLLSWMALRMKCRSCGIRISWLYPAFELVMAGVFGLYAALYGVPTGWYAIDYLVLFALVALFFFDLRHQVLPDAIIAPLGGVVLVRMVSLRPDLLVNAVAMGVLLSTLLGILYAVSRGRWLGLGDVKLAAVLGMLFGFPQAIGVTLMAVWAGALVGVGMIVRHRATMQTALPFGSFWAAAAVVAMFVPGIVSFLSGLFVPAFQ